MKRSLALITLAATLLSTAAVAQSVGEKTGVNSTLGIAPKTVDFIKEAATSDMLEIAAAKIKELVKGDEKAALPTSLDESSEKTLAKLKDAKPEDFASEYDPMQVSAHKDATSLFERYANGGDDPKLKEWAGKTLPALQHHLEMAQDMNKNRK
jgi:putative membrane protein